MSELHFVSFYASLESMSTWWKLRSARLLTGSSRDDEQGFATKRSPAFELDWDQSELIRGGQPSLLELAARQEVGGALGASLARARRMAGSCWAEPWLLGLGEA